MKKAVSDTKATGVFMLCNFIFVYGCAGACDGSMSGNRDNSLDIFSFDGLFCDHFVPMVAYRDLDVMSHKVASSQECQNQRPEGVLVRVAGTIIPTSMNWPPAVCRQWTA